MRGGRFSDTWGMRYPEDTQLIEFDTVSIAALPQETKIRVIEATLASFQEFAEPARVLVESEAMSRENATDYAVLDPRTPWEVPWLVALTVLVRRVDSLVPSLGRHVLPVYDGDRPAGLTDKAIEAEMLAPRFLMQGDHLGSRLSWRAALRAIRAPRAIRDTHRDVHRALADDDTSWCVWCAKGGAR